MSKTQWRFNFLRWPISLILGAAMVAPWALAAPFSRIIQFTQPDGTPIELRGQGDEFHAVFETLEGYTVLFDESVQGYCFAQLSVDGTELVSTGETVRNGTPQTQGLQPHLRINPETAAQIIAKKRAQWDADLEISTRWKALKEATALEASGDPRLAPPSRTTVGTKVGLTLLIDFPDVAGTVPQEAIADFCNADNYSSFGNRASVKGYFQYNSNGKLTYSNVVTVYIRVPQPKTYYNNITKDAGLQGRLLINDAIAAMKALPNYTTEILPTFGDLSVDSQNRVLALNVLFAGADSGRWSYGLWPHSWVLASAVELSPGGKRVYAYQITNIGSQLSIGTFVHENGHLLCGYPDLYDYTGASSGVGDWCLMASGSWGGSGSNPGNNPTQISAYLKRASGWASTIELDSTNSLAATVSALPGPLFNQFYRYTKPGTSREYYLIECRYKTNHDAYLPGSGVAVWHIDEQGDNSSVNLKTNSVHNNYEATLVQADNQWDLERNRNSGDSRDVFYSGNGGNRFSDETAPSARWWNGTPSGLTLREFSVAGPTMTFSVGTNDPMPTIIAQPESLTLVPQQKATFTVTATGATPLYYRWQKDGSLIGGATTSTYTIGNVQPTSAGDYQVLVSNLHGSTLSSIATLSVLPTVPLATALNNSELGWQITQDAPWYGQTEVSHDDGASGRSYYIGHGQSSSLRTTVNGPGTLVFWWRVSSQPDADYLSFRRATMEIARIAGETVWQEVTVYLPPGAQPLEWVYSKDDSVVGGQDQGWLDQVRYAAGATSPFISRQPADQASIGGSPVVFEVEAQGTPTLRYQWSLNGVALPGATNTSFAIASPSARDSGRYTVEVVNSYGSTLSEPALLGVVPLARAGDNSFGQVSVPAGATNPVSLAAGGWHSLALNSDGTVLAWGENTMGQCTVPPTLQRVVSIAAGGYHSLALTREGTVTGWGGNLNGQSTPPSDLSGVIQLAAGTWHSLALRADGMVAAWGDNTWKQSSVPAGLNNVVAVAAGGNHSLALRANGTVVAWGENTDASGRFVGQSVVPWNLSQVVSIGAGHYHSLAVKSDGTVVAWGDNAYGQAQAPAGLTGVVAVCAGEQHTVALLANGSLIGWGANWNGQIQLPSSITNATMVAAGTAHSLVLLGERSSRPVLMYATLNRPQFSVVTKTAAGKWYALEFKSQLADGDWTASSAVFGDGSPRLFLDRNAGTPSRIYRLRSW